MFKRAERKKAKLRLAMLGPSGSGKTYSALQVASGLGGSIAFIDTENGSGELYAHLCDYDICQITPPFTPDKYVNAIHEAERAGYDIIIIDSLSHAWAGSGGLLEQVDQRKGVGNQFSAWRDVTPMHNQFVDAMVQSQAHIIATMRTKTGYEMQKDDRGKVVPVKIGLQPVQRDGLEYEFTVVMDLDLEKHVAHASKDRTSIFDGQYFTPTADTGRTLREWLESGIDPAKAVLDAALAVINGCNTMTSLQRVWAENVQSWKLHPRAFDAIVKAKDDRKGRLAPANEDQTMQDMPEESRHRDEREPGSGGMGDPVPSGEHAGQDQGQIVPMTDAQRKAIMAHYKGADRSERLADLSNFFQREITSANDLTKDMASEFIDAINRKDEEAA